MDMYVVGTLIFRHQKKRPTDDSKKFFIKDAVSLYVLIQTDMFDVRLTYEYTITTA